MNNNNPTNSEPYNRSKGREYMLAFWRTTNTSKQKRCMQLCLGNPKMGKKLNGFFVIDSLEINS